MMSITFNTLLLTSLCVYNLNFCFADSIEKDLKLELVQVLFRHGARTPLEDEAKLIPNNTENNYNPQIYGQLHTKGMLDEYKIGRMLKNRYKDFLSDVYSPKEVYAYSSGYDRTKESLQLVLAALYPPTSDNTWNENLNWIPIAIHSVPKELDNILCSRLCPRFIDALEEYFKSNETKKHLEKYKDIMQMMHSIYGNDFRFSDITSACNIIKIHKELNLTLPTWYTDEVYTNLTKAMNFYINAYSYTPILKRLHAGPIIRKFIENIQKSDLKTNTRKIYLYSGHDMNVSGVLKVHYILNINRPDYGNTIIIEKLRDKQGAVFIRLLFWDRKPEKLVVLKIGHCKELCPINEYLKILSPVLPSDKEMQCLLENHTPDTLEKILNI